MKGFGDKVPIFKNQLIEYAQKSGLPSPVYNIIKEGPEHERRYKATVVIDNETYESPTYYLNLKKAEHGAAEVALAAIAAKSGKISAVPNPLHESGLCKNILQQYAQKCHFALPVYTFVKSGETHSPLFNGSVKIGGVTYTGGICKSKKEAEIKAAKTALIAICSDPDKPPLEAFAKQTPTETTGSSTAKTKAKKKRHKKQRQPKAAKRMKLQSASSTIITSCPGVQTTSTNTLNSGISPSDPNGSTLVTSHGGAQTTSANSLKAGISPIHPNGSTSVTGYGGVQKSTGNTLTAGIAPTYPNGPTFVTGALRTSTNSLNTRIAPTYANAVPTFVTNYGGVRRTITLNADIAPTYPIGSTFVTSYGVVQRTSTNTLNAGIPPSYPSVPTFVAHYGGVPRNSPNFLNACVLPSYPNGGTFVTGVQRTAINTLNPGIAPAYPTFVPSYGGNHRTRN